MWLQSNAALFEAETPANEAKKRLFVDVSVIHQHDARTGIQRVVRAIWSELERANLEGYEVLPVIASPGHGYCLLDIPTGKRMAPAGARRDDIFLGLDLSAHLLPMYRRQLRVWRNTGARLYVIVYDLLPLRHPQYFKTRTSRVFARWLDCVREDVDHAICISRGVALELQAFIEASGAPGKQPVVSTIKLGSDIEASTPSCGITPEGAAALMAAAQGNAILMVGTLEPRKGYEIALAALERCWADLPAKDQPTLIIVGQPGWKTENLQAQLAGHPQSGEKLIWLQDASDEVLEKLYCTCSLLLSTSHAEGFGLPIWEASAHGLKTVMRDLEIFREMDVPDAIYFFDDDPSNLSAVIQEALSRPTSSRATHVQTWADCVGTLISLIGLTDQGVIRSEKKDAG